MKEIVLLLNPNTKKGDNLYSIIICIVIYLGHFYQKNCSNLLFFLSVFSGKTARVNKVAPLQGLQPQDPGGTQGTLLQGP